MRGPGKLLKTADGQEWRPSVERLLDERHIVRDGEYGLIGLVFPGHPERYPYPPGSFTVAAGGTNQTRVIEQLLACPWYLHAETWKVGNETVTIERPAEVPPWGKGVKLLIIWSATLAVVEFGAAIAADNLERMLLGRILGRASPGAGSVAV